MSFLSAVLGVVGVVAAVASGGLLAGAVVALGVLAANHVIGGSIGKFFNSGWGKGLVAAVALGSAAYNMFSSGAAAAQSGQAATTTSGFMAQNGVDASTTQAMQDPSLMSEGLTPVDVNAANATADAASGGAGAGATDAASTTVANSSQVAAQQTASAEAATGAAGPSGAASTTPISNLNPIQTAGAQDATGATVAPEPGAADAAAPTTPAGAQQAVAPGGQTAAAAASGSPANQGMLSKAVGLIDKHPGLASMAGNAISGYAQGRSQESMMDKQIAAMQWANMQWQNPQQVAQLQTAAAAPITVPSGYLSRAAAVRNLMTGNQSQTGPVSGVQPLPQRAPALPPPNMAAGG